MNIRYDALMERIEEACKISINNNGKGSQVLRLGDITESSQGIIPYIANPRVMRYTPKS
jgi:hypothetical protein